MSAVAGYRICSHSPSDRRLADAGKCLKNTLKQLIHEVKQAGLRYPGGVKMTNMDLSEKIVKLRKNNNLTQEQLAEQLNVSRQSVSKWESGQAAPDIDKIVAMGEIFHVTTDYLLKPSELDELAMKTEMLEKRQREILENEEKRKEKQYCICVCASIYIIAFALFMLIRQVSWINDVLWNIFPGATLPVIILLIATAAAILVCVRRKQRGGRQES